MRSIMRMSPFLWLWYKQIPSDYLYFSGLPGVSPDEEPENIAKLKTLSQHWELQLLESICINIEQGESHVNPSIAVSHNTLMGENLSKDFLLANKWTDVSFDVEGDVHDLRMFCVLSIDLCI